MTAAGAPLGDRDPRAGKHPVDELNQAVSRVLTVAGVEPAPRFLTALQHQRLLPWESYTAVLFDIEVPLLDRRRLKSLWAAASLMVATRTSSGDPQREPLTPDPVLATVLEWPLSTVVRPMLDIELQATSEPEFTRLLRTIQQRSGHSPAEISRLTEIPRSQAYSLISRESLPTRPQQVRSFVTACGLPPAQLQRVMRLWSDLYEVKNRRATTTPVEHAHQPTKSSGRPQSFEHVPQQPGQDHVAERLLADSWPATPLSTWQWGSRRAEGGRCDGTGEFAQIMSAAGITDPEPTFAQVLRAMRLDRGLSLSRFAQLVHYSKGYLSKIENGMTRPNKEFAYHVDRVLGTNLSLVALFEREASGGAEPDSAVWRRWDVKGEAT